MWSKMIILGSAMLLANAIVAMMLAMSYGQTPAASSAENQWEEKNVRFLLMACLLGLMGVLASFTPDCCDRRPTLAFLFAIAILSASVNISTVRRSALAARIQRCEMLATSNNADHLFVTTTDREGTHMGAASRRLVGEREALGDRVVYFENLFIMFGIGCTVALFSTLSYAIAIYGVQQHQQEILPDGTGTTDKVAVVDCEAPTKEAGQANQTTCFV